MNSWNKKILVGVALVVAQLIIYGAIMGRDSSDFSILSFFITSLPGIIGGFIIWYERSRGRF